MTALEITLSIIVALLVVRAVYVRRRTKTILAGVLADLNDTNAQVGKTLRTTREAVSLAREAIAGKYAVNPSPVASCQLPVATPPTEAP